MNRIFIRAASSALAIGLIWTAIACNRSTDPPAPSPAPRTTPSTIGSVESGIPHTGLIVDLDADKGVETEGDRVVNWRNQIDWKAKDFKATRDTGRPSLQKNLEALGGHAALNFQQQELINGDEDAFDRLVTGNGYTWLMVLSAAPKQPGLEPNVNAIFGDLKNGPQFEGLWAALDDDDTIWIGSRNSNSFGRWNDDNPKVSGPKLEPGRFYAIAGRMAAGTGEGAQGGKVPIELFVNEPKPAASKPFPVNPKANSSKMAIGQERDATNHPGRESFNGQIARLLFWERPLTDAELTAALEAVKKTYGLK